MAMTEGTVPSDPPSETSDRTDTERHAALFHALSDRTRLLVLQHLATGPHRVRDLVDHLGLAQSTVSAHLACLRDCGLVLSRPEGRASLFSLAAPEGVASLISVAAQLIDELGSSQALGVHVANHHEREAR